MAEVLHIEKRETRGKRFAKRMRKIGKIPGILYGHGKEAVSLTIIADEIDATIRHGARLVELQGDVKDSAFVKSIQWDAFGAKVLHVDLTRVEAGDSVEISLSIELRGVAPGTKQGGVTDHQLHELEIRCPVTAIPESLSLSINHLELDQTITAGEIELPPGTELLTVASAVVVSCTEPDVREEDAEEITGAPSDIEPEVIGRKAEDEESEKS
jgi:large subunit ribosomal protein L25